MICIAIANCGWTLLIAENPISCNNVPSSGCTYFDKKLIYVDYWNPCVIKHEINEHALKRNYDNHPNICKKW